MIQPRFVVLFSFRCVIDDQDMLCDKFFLTCHHVCNMCQKNDGFQNHWPSSFSLLVRVSFRFENGCCGEGVDA